MAFEMAQIGSFFVSNLVQKGPNDLKHTTDLVVAFLAANIKHNLIFREKSQNVTETLFAWKTFFLQVLQQVESSQKPTASAVPCKPILKVTFLLVLADKMSVSGEYK